MSWRPLRSTPTPREMNSFPERNVSSVSSMHQSGGIASTFSSYHFRWLSGFSNKTNYSDRSRSTFSNWGVSAGLSLSRETFWDDIHPFLLKSKWQLSSTLSGLLKKWYYTFAKLPSFRLVRPLAFVTRSGKHRLEENIFLKIPRGIFIIVLFINIITTSLTFLSFALICLCLYISSYISMPRSPKQVDR